MSVASDKYLKMADSRHENGDNLKAIEYYKKAIELEGDNPKVWGNMGVVYGIVGRKKKALSCLERAVKLDSNYWKARHNLGIMYMGELRYREAIKQFEKILEFEPKYADVMNDLALCWMAEKDLKKAMSLLIRVVGMVPEKVAFQCNMGSVYAKLLMVDHAEQCFLNCLALDPGFGEAYINLAVLYLRSGREKESKKMLQLAIENPVETAGYHAELGFLLQENGRIKEALIHMEMAEKMESSYPSLLTWLYLASRQCLEWDRLEELESKIKRYGSEEPFLSIVMDEDDVENYRVARIWSEEIKKTTSHLGVNFSYHDAPKEKIRVGFMSYDFRNHPVGQMMASSMEMFDRSKFEIVGLSYGEDDGSRNREMIKTGVDEWVDFCDSGDYGLDMAVEINKRKIDILVDTTGFTRGNRFGVMALRPAPIQIEWLGYPGTTGADYVDYVIADKIVLPEQSQPYFSEKPVYLPCYQINNASVLPESKKYTRKDFNLPDKGVVFASFNQTYKLEPRLLDSWVRIMKRVPGSVLWLWQQSLDFYQGINREVIKRGLDPERIILGADMPKAKHLDRLGLADLCLDTFTYGGHTTTTDSLWAGVPVVTVLGKHFASRVSASILSRVGLSDMVCGDVSDYEELAVSLVFDEDKLARIRNKIKRNKLCRNLFDTKDFVVRLEKGFQKMNWLYKNGKQPEVIDLSDI